VLVEVRWEDNNVFDTSLTGRASAALLIHGDRQQAPLRVGAGFRAPTINDLFSPASEFHASA
jgi:outer membrane cobalamin receptor